MSKKKAKPIATSQTNAASLRAAVAQDEAVRRGPANYGEPIGEAAWKAWKKNQA